MIHIRPCAMRPDHIMLFCQLYQCCIMLFCKLYKYCSMLFCQPPVLSSWYSAILWSSHISCSSRWPHEPPIPWGLSVPIKIISLPMLTWAYSQQTGGRTLQGLMIMVNVCQAKVNIVEWWVTSQPNNSHVKLHIEWNNSWRHHEQGGLKCKVVSHEW